MRQKRKFSAGGDGGRRPPELPAQFGHVVFAEPAIV
jgi:hypothetical protein